MPNTDYAAPELAHSVLRRLPPTLTPVQMVALDVVSHASDIVSLSGQRLRSTLTDIAIARQATGIQIASAFADAWSVVDAVDRIRSMVRLLHKHLGREFKEVTKDFDHTTQSIRELRNLTDHLPGQVDRVVASNMPAIGRLSWITVESTQRVLSCVLDPGTARTTKKSMKLPLGGRSIVVPTGAILLSAGGSQAYLEDAAAAVAELVGLLEAYVEQVAAGSGVPDAQAGRDFLAVGELALPDQIPVQFHSPQGNLF